MPGDTRIPSHGIVLLQALGRLSLRIIKPAVSVGLGFGLLMSPFAVLTGIKRGLPFLATLLSIPGSVLLFGLLGGLCGLVGKNYRDCIRENDLTSTQQGFLERSAARFRFELDRWGVCGLLLGLAVGALAGWIWTPERGGGLMTDDVDRFVRAMAGSFMGAPIGAFIFAWLGEIRQGLRSLLLGK